jgi:hypothetical protein
MGLLDDAIREHLELMRLRGADPGKVAREEREVLGPTRRSDTTERPEDPDNPERPASLGGSHPSPSTKSNSEPDQTHMGQATVELDMRAVLQSEPTEHTRPHAPELGQCVPNSTPSPASRDHPATRLGRRDGSAVGSMENFA